VRFQTLNEWLTWQETLHPAEIELGLERILCVWRDMHAPAFSCPVISVAGTNGKGSSLAILQAIYLAAGYDVGTYTSPHLYKYNERVRINGHPVSDEKLIAAFEKIDHARQAKSPATSLTYFEFGTLAALDIFAHAELDVILLEVGLGGRLDAVNIIDADLALITSIDLDHQAWLGETREEIALEKAGILNKDKLCVISDPDAPSVIEEHAGSLNCKCFRAKRDFDYEIEQGHWRWQTKDKIRASLPLPALNGKHQCQNAAGVLMIIELFEQRLPVTQQSIRDGLVSSTLPGRFEIREGPVTIVLDVAHNPAAAAALAESIRAYAGNRRILCVFSILADKDLKEVVKPLIKSVAHWSVAPLNTNRTMQAEVIERELQLQLGVQDESGQNEISQAASVQSHSSVADALSFVQKFAHPGDIILVYGSFHIVAEAGAEHV
jgi:dihydrofolate synthase/folylpolyglutamate synthase